MAGSSEIAFTNRGPAAGDGPAPPSRLMAALDPSTVGLSPSALLTSAPAQGRSPAKAGPSMRGKRRAIIEGSLANGPKATLSLKDDSGRAREHAAPGDDLRTTSPMGGLLHQGVIKIS
jgi:hypothetical protein